MTNKVAIGIDLGTTYSSVAVFRNNEVELIPNEHGSYRTPSCVSFTDRGVVVGEAALNQGVRNYRNTVFDIKRLIGRKLDDISLPSGIKHWPFTIISTDSGYPDVQVEFKGEKRSFTPEVITAIILNNLKQTAEAFLGFPVKNVVISVPAHFNEFQRQATKDAGTISGLNVVKLVSGTALASVAYCFNKKTDEERNLLIFDLGGGTLSVSIVTVEDGIFEVKAVAGNNNVTGAHFTSRIVSYCSEEFKKTHGKDISSNARAIRRLRTACERAKIQLTSSNKESIEIESLCEGVDFRTDITRARFEELCMDLFHATMEPVEQVLRDAKMDKSAVHEIVLVGGSSRIPKFQQTLSTVFGGKTLSKGINPEEAVAVGAAIQAAISAEHKSAAISNILCLDCYPRSICVGSGGGAVTTLLRPNTTIPEKTSKKVTVRSREEQPVQLQIYEGSRANESRLLGKLELACNDAQEENTVDGKTRCMLIDRYIEVTLDIDAIGGIQVYVKDLNSDATSSIIINISRLTKEEIRTMREALPLLMSNEEHHHAEVKDLREENIQLKEQNYRLKRRFEDSQHQGDENKQLKEDLEEVQRKYRKLQMQMGRQDNEQ